MDSHNQVKARFVRKARPLRTLDFVGMIRKATIADSRIIVCTVGVRSSRQALLVSPLDTRQRGQRGW